METKKMQGVVRALFIAPEKKSRPVSVERIVTNEKGIDGDWHSRSVNRRQILMISQSILNQFKLEPGSIFENVVVDGIDVMSLIEGQQLRMGEAVLEVTIPCEPCIQMDKVQPGLKEALRDRRGMFARVVTPGAIHVGDIVES